MDEEEGGGCWNKFAAVIIVCLPACLLLLLSGPHPFGNQVKFPI